MTIDSTVAKIGRSMKKCEIMVALIVAFGGSATGWRPWFVTVTLLEPSTLPRPAVPRRPAATFPLPGESLAVNNPSSVIVPTVVVQANFGCAANGLPNWSSPVAVNCCAASGLTFAVAGLTAMLVRVCSTGTLKLLLTDSPPESAIVTVNP